MARGFFVALGIFAVILGLESLVVDHVVLRSNAAAPAPQPAAASQSYLNFRTPMAPPAQSAGRTFHPPEWAPWSLLASGAVTILYAFALPKKISISA